MTQLAKHITISLLTIFFSHAFCYAQNDSTKIRHPILKVVRKISKYKTIEKGPIGISGKLTKQFHRFIFLMDQATDNELIALTNYKSAKVRAYAFEALVAKGSKDVKQILENHISDISIINIRDGCMSSTEHVNLYFLQLLTPSIYDKSPNNKLTEDEVKKMKTKMADAIRS